MAIRTLETLYHLGTRIIIFEGGEPLLWRDGVYHLHDLILYARRYFLRIAVTTNGTLPLDLPSHILWVSLDGTKKHMMNCEALLSIACGPTLRKQNIPGFLFIAR